MEAAKEKAEQSKWKAVTWRHRTSQNTQGAHTHVKAEFRDGAFLVFAPK